MPEASRGVLKRAKRDASYTRLHGATQRKVHVAIDEDVCYIAAALQISYNQKQVRGARYTDSPARLPVA